jgi:hypothetical protein
VPFPLLVVETVLFIIFLVVRRWLCPLCGVPGA